MKLQSAVKKETVAVAAGTGIGCLALIALFLVFYLIFPESSVKFDYRVVLGALVGGAVAVANFFLMAVTVQNVVNVTNRDDALRMMRVSYRNRMLMRGIWIIIAIFAPCFNYAAGIIPLGWASRAKMPRLRSGQRQGRMQLQLPGRSRSRRHPGRKHPGRKLFRRKKADRRQLPRRNKSIRDKTIRDI